jgi:hypothetical protein
MVATAALARTAFDSRNKTKPYLVAYFDCFEYTFSSLAFVIENAGQTAAKNIKVIFDTELDRNSRVYKRFVGKVIPVIVPKQKLTSVWYMRDINKVEADGTCANREMLPRKATVVLTYRNHWYQRGIFLPKAEYLLDLEQMFYEAEPVESNSMLGCIRTVSKTLSANVPAVNKSLDKIARILNENADIQE